LKKYGLTRPDFSVNSPKHNAFRARARSRNSVRDDVMVGVGKKGKRGEGEGWGLSVHGDTA
jgi:hypothetical protein